MKFVTLDGSILWLVSAKRNGHSYSVQSETHRGAWTLAWRLAQQLRLTGRTRNDFAFAWTFWRAQSGCVSCVRAGFQGFQTA